MRKDLKLEERTLVECEVTDVDFDKISETKLRPDAIPREKLATEKITVRRRDIIPREEQQKPQFRKDLDIGRIVIEEIPEEKEEEPERDIFQKEPARPMGTDMPENKREVKELPKKYIKVDAVKVGKLDTSDLDRVTGESRRVEERIKTQRETIDGRKVRCN